MNYKKRDDELIKLNKQARAKNSVGNNSGNVGYTNRAFESRRKLPVVTNSPNKATTQANTPVKTKPSTRYSNQTAGDTTPKQSTRDTRYDKDFDSFYEYRYSRSDMMDYDPTTGDSTPHWQNMKKEIMAKNKWSENEFDTKWSEYDKERNKKEADKEINTMVQLGKEHPILGTIGQAAYMPQTMIEGAGAMLSNLMPTKYKAQSADDGSFTGTRVREATKQAVKDEHIKSKVGKTAYDVGTSLADMVIGSGIPVLGAASLGLETAARTNMNALERGVDPNRAAATAGIAGLVSGAMNKIGLDKAAGATGKTALGKMVKGAGVEAAENLLEDTANLGVDTAINTDKSQISALHDYYTSQGIDDKEAWNRVRLDTLGDLATSALSGAAFGGVMNGVRNLPSLIPEIRDLTRGLELNNRGGVDTPEISKELNKAIPAPAKVDSVGESAPTETTAPIPQVEPVRDNTPTNIEPTAESIPEQPVNNVPEVTQNTDTNDYEPLPVLNNNERNEVDTYLSERERLLQVAKDISNPEDALQAIRSINAMDGYMYDKYRDWFDETGSFRRAEYEGQANTEEATSNTKNGLTAEEQAELQNELADEYDWTDNRVPEVTQPTSDNVPPTNEPPVEPPTVDSMIEPPTEGKDIRRESKVGTDTGVRSGLFTEHQVHNDPIISELNKYIPSSEQESFDNALMNVDKNGDELLNDYITGKKEINNDTDVDQSMIILTNLTNRLNAGDTSVEAQRNLLFSRLRQAGTKYGQTINAFKKWNNTAEGTIANGEGLIGETVKKWKESNKKAAEFNGRIAEALKRMGYDGSMDKKPTVKTHEQIREGVKNVIEREFGSVEQYFDEKDIDYLTTLAEDKSIPTWKITDEIEHKLATGEWYTLDESTPVKKAFSSKLNTVLKNMGDDSLKEANKKLDNGYPKKSHATIVEEVKNSLEKEMAGVGLDKPTDIEFLATMIEERVPNWQIEDEIRHRLDTGEWYSLDESIEPKYPINQRLKNALDSLVDTEPAPVKEPPTLDEIRNQVRATLDKEYVNRRETGDFTDEDVEYLANLINEGATKDELADALNAKMATGRFGISTETQQAVSDLFRYANQFDPDSKKAYDLRTAAYKMIANEAVSEDASPFEKFDSWRYLAMLGNPKTWVRNKIGNEMFNVVTGVSNNIAAALEAGADKAYRTMGGEGIQRTKAFLNPVDDRTLIKAATEDGDNHRYTELLGSKYERGVKDAIKQQKSVFNSKALRTAEAVVDWGVSDYKNVKRKYGTSLAGYMKANGLDENAFKADNRYRDLLDKSRSQLLTDAEKAEMNSLKPIYDELEKARDYAVKQAEYATFHEPNVVASLLSKHINDWRSGKIKVNGEEYNSNIAKGLGYALEGTLPFKRTPANILKSGFEYSPFGAIKSVAETRKLIYENTGSRKGNLEDTYTKKNKLTGSEKTVHKSTASEVIDSWSKTLTGTGLMFLGMFLKDNGILNSSNKDEEYQDQLEGIQNYSITINGHTYTVDWAAPGVMPLLMGAELSKIKDRNLLLNKNWYESSGELLSTVNSILDPMFETSMLSGVKDTLSTAANDIKYKENSDVGGGILGSIAFNMGTGYLTQGIPTLSGQIARIVDNTRRSTDTVSDQNKEPYKYVLERQGRKIMNKIPGLSRLNQPYYDSYGRTQRNGPKNPLLNIAYQMGSPGYMQKINTTDADKSARDVYYSQNAEGEYLLDKDVFPSWKSKVTVNGEKYTPEQMATYRKASGEAQYNIRDTLAKDDWFNNLDGEKQTEILKKVNTLVDKIGKDANGDGSDNKELGIYQSDGVPGLINYWHGSDELAKFRDESGISTSTNAYKEIKALYEEGNFEEGNKVAEKAINDNEARLKYNEENGTNIGLADWQKKYSDTAPTTSTQSTSTTTRPTVTEAIQPSKRPHPIGSETTSNEKTSVDNTKYQKQIDRAGSQKRKFENDLPTLVGMGAAKPETYTYAYAINQDPSLNVKTYHDTYTKLNYDRENAVSQQDMINYFNANNISEKQGMYYWTTYGEKNGKPWKTLPTLSNGKWKK